MHFSFSPSRRRAAILLAGILPLASACGAIGSKGKGRKLPAPVQEVFVHGDPMQLVAGRSLDRTSFLTQDNRADFEDFNFIAGAVFQRTSKKSSGETSQASLEKENEASTAENLDDVKHYGFRDAEDGKVIYEARDVEGDKQLRLGLAPVDGRLAVTTIAGFEVEPLHYSVSASGDAFSILARAYEANSDSTLIALYFTKNHANFTRPEALDREYNYLLGPGVATRWQDSTELSLCGAFEPAEQRQVDEAIAMWVKDGKVGELPMTVKRDETQRPFSDVNTHCLEMVDDFLFENVEDAAVLGLAVTAVDKTRQAIVASNVFISRKGIAKIYGEDFRPERYLRTIAHELGHFLGLDHEFDRNEFGTIKNPSIMGYSGVDWITEHDEAAIQALYGAYAE